MMTQHVIELNELDGHRKIHTHKGGTLEKRAFADKLGNELTVLVIDNGKMTFTVVPERGLEIGGIWLEGEPMSWDRSDAYLLHPDNVDLQVNGGTGWLDGFYSAVASIGPELFGTPGEGYTLHGTSSYSPAAPESVRIHYDEEGVRIEGKMVCKGYAEEPVFEKEISMFTRWDSSVLLREEKTANVSGLSQTLDDGYHIQLSGPYLHDGGRYVLPAEVHSLLLRDSAPLEEHPLRIPARHEGLQPIRCYQYVPEAVPGLDDAKEIRPYVSMLDSKLCTLGITAEMVINHANTGAGFVIRPLDCFPKSLIAKEVSDSFMFSFEPCRTRPNRMSQKHIDGEAFVLAPGAQAQTQCIIGVSANSETLNLLEKLILRSR